MTAARKDKNLSSWWDLAGPEAAARARALSELTDGLRDAGHKVYPPRWQVFRALSTVAPGEVKVVILGQDPYHEAGQANGLAFSVPPGVKLPPSLRNIFKELHADLGCAIPSNGDLTPWAEQGVLLLNTVLTVEDGTANTHKDLGWQEVTHPILRCCGQLPQPIVFLAWGKQAIQLTEAALADRVGPKRILASTHPSPLSATRAAGDVPAFIGSRPFSRANAFLSAASAAPIDWTL